ncbi:MAG: hypothetical protein AAFP04_12175 [Myxococcota bacterium]
MNTQASGLPAYTLRWLLGRALARGLIDESAAQSVLVGEAQQRARLSRAAEGERRAPDRINPAELLASFRLAARDGKALDDDRLAALLAVGTGLD